MINGEVERHHAVTTDHVNCSICRGVGCGIISRAIPVDAVTGSNIFSSSSTLVDGEMQGVGAGAGVGIGIVVCICPCGGMGRSVPCITVAG